jgi:hypothetical protein
MKAVTMKSMVVFLLLAFSATIFAQTPKNEQLLNKAKVNYLRTLNSDYNSIVESSIFITMEMKNRFPEADFDKLIDRLNELAVEGNTPTVRYKAQIASLFINFHGMFSDIKFTEKDNPEKYFKEISDRLTQFPVAVNN